MAVCTADRNQPIWRTAQIATRVLRADCATLANQLFTVRTRSVGRYLTVTGVAQRVMQTAILPQTHSMLACSDAMLVLVQMVRQSQLLDIVEKRSQNWIAPLVRDLRIRVTMEEIPILHAI
jgi:hypothetical protein